MATIETKFSIGDLVKHFTGVSGMITAIFIRSGVSYELCFCENDKPSCVCVEECEIFATNEHGLGFKGSTKNDLS